MTPARFLTFLVSALILALAPLVAVLALRVRNPTVDNSLRIVATDRRIKRGEYLTLHVAECLTCHSEKDWHRFGHPVLENARFVGGEGLFDQRLGIKGRFYPGNLTPYGLARYSDGELVRVIRTGVTKEGRHLIPRMPYKNYSKMDREDLYSIVSYLRSLKPIKKRIPEAEPDFTYSLQLYFEDRSVDSIPERHDNRNPVEQGKYLVTLARCGSCHTPNSIDGLPVKNRFLAGGMVFPCLDLDQESLPVLPGCSVKSANITPDPETGIKNLSCEQFVDLFRDWRGDKGLVRMAPIHSGDFTTMMPWRQYSGMHDDDLAAIYAYLRTIPPVRNPVETYSPR